jgi:hypothetical protein
MKKFLVVVLAIASFGLHAQDTKIVTEEFTKYTKLMLDKKFDAGLDYMNPGIFEMAPKEQLLVVMEQTFNNPELDIEMSMPDLLSFSETKKINETFYVKFKTSSVIKMRFNTLINAEKTAEENQTTINMVKENLNAKFGAENVSYDDQTRFFTLKAVKPVIASSADKKIWKFITVDSEAQKPMLEKFIPKELLVD